MAIESNFLQLAKDRYSVRHYSSQPVEEEKIKALEEIIKYTPTGINRQPHRMVVVKSPEAMEKLLECTPYQFGAPLAFVMFYDSYIARINPITGRSIGDIDSSIALTHVMLAATDMGLGTCWVGAYNPYLLKQNLGVPRSYVDVGILYVGYPSERAHPARLHFESKELSELVCEI